MNIHFAVRSLLDRLEGNEAPSGSQEYLTEDEHNRFRAYACTNYGASVEHIDTKSYINFPETLPERLIADLKAAGAAIENELGVVEHKVEAMVGELLNDGDEPAESEPTPDTEPEGTPETEPEEELPPNPTAVEPSTTVDNPPVVDPTLTPTDPEGSEPVENAPEPTDPVAPTPETPAETPAPAPTPAPEGEQPTEEEPADPKAS